MKLNEIVKYEEGMTLKQMICRVMNDVYKTDVYNVKTMFGDSVPKTIRKEKFIDDKTHYLIWFLNTPHDTLMRERVEEALANAGIEMDHSDRSGIDILPKDEQPLFKKEKE